MPSPADVATLVAQARSHIEADDYADRVYAALLGKVIGVYAGRPFEGWTHARITERFGQIDRYVASDLGKPLIVTDDDIAGTMTFIRAVQDSGRGYDTTSDDIADTWLNYLIEERSVLWWGGMGNSTEHTAYLRLKAGHRPPESGSAALNGRVVSEQIGAQIFIDGWGLIAPGTPRLAAVLARRAALVSHDGEAVHGAQMIAAMESAAFTTDTIDDIIDAGLSTIPSDSLIAQVVRDLRSWRSDEPDWEINRARLDQRYGYHLYGGGCHIIPNFGVIILTLLHCDGDFSTAMTIVNTAGWDTDCNAGNVGCLLGLISGTAGMSAPYDWRGPVRDRIYVPTADGGGSITDVAQQANRIVEIARNAAALPVPARTPRFDFAFPGSLQGFQLNGPGTVANEPLPPSTACAETGRRGLHVRSDGAVELTTATFIPPEAQQMASYPLDASPTLYSGQTLSVTIVITELENLRAGGDAMIVVPFVRFYDDGDTVSMTYGAEQVLPAGTHTLHWRVPDLQGKPILEVGLSLPSGGDRVHLARLDWVGTPDTDLVRSPGTGEMWRRSWVSETDFTHPDPELGLRLVSNGPRRLSTTGSGHWDDYRFEATIRPHAADAVGVAVHVEGLRRYLLLRLTSDGQVQLIRRSDQEETVLARHGLDWQPGRGYAVTIDVAGDTVTALVDGQLIAHLPHSGGSSRGAIGISCEGGRLDCSRARIQPLGSPSDRRRDAEDRPIE
jgi:ADP-ribosylglycohydrolase